MKRKSVILVLLVLLLTGCGAKKQPNTLTITTESQIPTTPLPTTQTEDASTVILPIVPVPEPVVELDYEVVKPNEMGNILVVMYHGIYDNQPYHIPAEQFRRDLQYMYDNGYRLISMSDYLSGQIDIPAGTTPIVLTFDDGLPTTFSLEEREGQLVPVKDTAVYIIEEFSDKYPDFGRNAIFYVNTSNGMFTGAGTEQERLQWLVDRGYEVSTHTDTHINMDKAPKDLLLKEIGGSIIKLHDLLGEEYVMESFAYPFGSKPSGELEKYVLDGTYENSTYSFKIGLAVGASGPFVTPYHINFNKYKAPRARGSEGDIQDLWWFFKDYEKNPQKKYISDGMIDRLSVPAGKEENINKEALPEGIEIYIY
ncbi:MAG: uncharacterized protein K0R15_1112 [Clostridiales bacterium]|jgi:peptidoglycan/xylan/chitin deacetylase (PgdA/CDA1 family)|nr:uncharacterized protein [Clostridiales bacterium]